MEQWLTSFSQMVVAWDRASFLWLNEHVHCTALNWTMPVVTSLGLGQVQAVGVLLIAVWAGWRAGEVRRGTAYRDARAAIGRRRWWVGPLLVCLVLSLSANLVKAATPRLRPWWFYLHEHKAGRHLTVRVLTVPGVHPLRVRGFPSGHTTSSVAIAAAVTVLFWRRRRGPVVAAAAWSVALLIAFSRIYLASHWPLDIVGGIVLGTACGLAAVAVARAWAHWRSPRRAVAQTAAPAAEPRL